MANLTQSQVRAILAQRPDGTSAAGVIAALRQQGHRLEGYPDPSSAPSDKTRKGPGEPNDPKNVSENRRALRNSLRGMTTAGGMTGGLLASKLPLPVRSFAAGLGGAIGRSAENFGAAALGYPDVPQDPLAAVRSLAGAFNEQSVAEGAGGVLSGLGGAFGRGSARYGLNPSPEVIKKYGEEVMDTFARERIPVGRFGRNQPRGSEMVERRRSAAAQKQTDAGLAYDATGRRFSSQEIADEAIARHEEELRRPLTPKERAALVTEVEDAMVGIINDPLAGGISRGPWQGFTADELLSVRQATDAGNTPYFTRRAKGVAPGEFTDPLEGDLGAGTRRLLRDRVPGSGEATDELRSLMGLKEAMVGAESARPRTLIPSLVAAPMATAGGLLGGDTPQERAAGAGAGALLGFLGTRAALDPRVLTRVGIALQDPNFLAVLNQLPRAAWAGLEPMFKETPDQGR